MNIIRSRHRSTLAHVTLPHPHIPGAVAAACAGEVTVEVKEGMEEVDFGKITLPEAFKILQARLSAAHFALLSRFGNWLQTWFRLV